MTSVVQVGRSSRSRIPLHLPEEPFDLVPTPHSGEDRVRATLQRRVELRAEVLAVGRRRDELGRRPSRAASTLESRIRQSPGMRSSRWKRCQRRNGGSPDLRRVPFDPVVPHVDAAEDDLPVAAIDERPHSLLRSTPACGCAAPAGRWG